MPKGKIKPFCSGCGAVDQLAYVEAAGLKAVKCEPCGRLYASVQAVWEEMKEHPNFVDHVGQDAGKLAAAEAKREMRAKKRSNWGFDGK